MIETCGNCRFGQVIAEEKDIQARIANRRCFGNPPQVLLVPQMIPGPKGPVASMSLQNCRPIVPASDPACSHWQPSAPDFGKEVVEDLADIRSAHKAVFD